MSLAVAKAILEAETDHSNLREMAVKYMQEVGRNYPNCGYGGGFYSWMFSNNPKTYNSYVNGAAMRVRAAALLPMGSVLAQHHVTVGLRYETDKWWAGLGYVIGLPASLRGNGHSSNVMGLDYAYSTLEQTQQSVLMGFGFRW